MISFTIYTLHQIGKEIGGPEIQSGCCGVEEEYLPPDKFKQVRVSISANYVQKIFVNLYIINL
jgi:hypothetical protein